MSTCPTVAIIVTTFDDPAFLGEALASARAQTHPATEVLVVDDGSRESPAPIVEGFPGVRLIRRENGGLSAARNTGLRAASSDLVVFLDADDRLEPAAVAAGLECFAERPEAAAVYGGHRRIGSDGGPLGPDRLSPAGEDPYASLLEGNVIGMHACVLYRRSVLLEAGGFDEGLDRCEDYDVYLRLARKHVIVSHPATVAEYRWHGANMSSDTGRMLRAVLLVHGRHADQRGSRRAAWRRGRRNWTAYYQGRRSTDETRTVAGVARRERLVDAARRLKARLRRGWSGRALRSVGMRWPPPLRGVRLGALGTPRPVSLDFGWDRGTPVDRHYVEGFLERHAQDIKGRALEVGDDAYCRRFGAGRVHRQDVLHVDPAVVQATLHGDLTAAGVLPASTFDCIVLTQTLQLIFDLPAAVARLHEALAPGGVLLLTVPGTISQVDRGAWGRDWCWGFTETSLRRLFETAFSPQALDLEEHGNVFAAMCFLQGLVFEEVDRRKLVVRDEAYPLILTLRAVKR